MTDATAAAWIRPKLWIGLATAVAVWATWVGSLAYGGWKRDADGMLLCADHIAFYSAATLLREGRPAELYHHPALGEVQQRVTLPDGRWDYFMAYRNPPFYALLYVPTAGLPLVGSVLVWMAISFAAIGFAAWCLRPERPWQVFGWALAFFPVFTAITFGQNTPLSLAVFAAVYRLSADRRPFAAGLAAGLLWYKPQLLIGLFVWWGLAPRRHLGEWLGVGVTGLVLAALCWLVIPEASWAFVESLRTNVGYGGENEWNLHSPRKFWDILLPAAPPELRVGLTLLCAAAALSGAAWLRGRTGGPLAVMFPTSVFVTLWVSPHTLIYEWALLVAAAVVLWDRLPARRDTWLTWFTVAWLGLTVSTTATLVQKRALDLPVLFQLSIPVLAVVGYRLFRALGDRRPVPAT
ncbi:MAG TPA: glycosyltransferase family 87 protein [Urbifossiella sp.]|nr:glycosyltransferase family 87 protein [Urbifossiella sp.]